MRGKISFWTLFWMFWNAIALAADIAVGGTVTAVFNAFVLGALCALAAFEVLGRI